MPAARVGNAYTRYYSHKLFPSSVTADIQQFQSHFCTQKNWHSYTTKARTTRSWFKQGHFRDHISSDGTKAKKHKHGNDTKTTGWTSPLLGSKSLGATPTIIVLRDSEKKRGGDDKLRGVLVQEKHLGDVGPEEISASIEKSKEEPSQEEVNQSIESLHPTTPGDDSEVTTISTASYDRTVAALMEQFNLQQLSSYITVHSRDSLSAQPEAQPESQTELSASPRYALRSEWQPLGPQPTKRKKLHWRWRKQKSKYALAETILKSLWRIEAAHEDMGYGYLEVNIEPKILPVLLVGGQMSALSRLGVIENAKIEVSKHKSTITVTADKHTCTRVLNQIDALLGDVHEKSVDFEPLRQAFLDYSGAHLDERSLINIGQKCSTIITVEKSEKKLVIRSLGMQDIERCLRALITAADLVSNKNKYLLIGGSSPNEQGVICGPLRRSWPASPSSGAGHAMFGRFKTPTTLSSVASDRSPEIPTTLLLSSAMDQVWDHLIKRNTFPRQDSSRGSLPASADDPHLASMAAGKSVGVSAYRPWNWQSSTRKTCSANYGHILHTSGQPFAAICGHDLLQHATTRNYTFVASTPALPRLLPLLSPCTTVENLDMLHFHLIRSPWQSDADTYDYTYSELDILLKLDRNSQSLRLHSLTATVAAAEVDVMLPHLPTDIQFRAEDTVELVDAEEISQIRRFVSSVQHAAAYPRTSTIPSMLEVFVPALDVGATPHKRNRADFTYTQRQQVKVCYYVVSQTIVQSVQLKHNGFDLSYSVTSGSQFASKVGKLSLRAELDQSPRGGDPAPRTMNVTDDTAPGRGNVLDFHVFAETASAIAKQIGSVV